MKSIRLLSNPVTTQLDGDVDGEVKKLISGRLGYTSEYNGTIRQSTFFKWGEGQFPTGFLTTVYKALTAAKYHVTVIRHEAPPPLGPPVRECVVDSFGNDPRYDYQFRTGELLARHRQIIAQVATGGGKCFRPGTEVLMSDGTRRKIEDVRVGDQLLGDDNTLRTVTGTHSGRSKMYRIKPTAATSYDEWVCNDRHTLSLKYCGRAKAYRDKDVVDIDIEDYLAENKTFKHCAKQFSVGYDGWDAVDFPHDPYLIGLWLGDGSVHGVEITNPEPEIREYLERMSIRHGMSLNDYARKKEGVCPTLALSTQRGKLNHLRRALHGFRYETPDGKWLKTIPMKYLTSSRQQRLQLLAGLIDTDGYLHKNSLEIIQKSKRLADAIQFLGRSLGYRVSRSEKWAMGAPYQRMHISGELSEIPTRVPRKRVTSQSRNKVATHTSFEVSVDSEDGEYVGIEVDGNHRFLLADFTVVHNSRVCKIAFKHLGRTTLFLTTRKVLMHQMRDSIMETMNIPVGMVGEGDINVIEGFNVGMVQTIAQQMVEKSVSDELMSTLDAQYAKEQKEIKAFTRDHLGGLSAHQRLERLKSFKAALVAKREPEREVEERVKAKVAAHNQRAVYVREMLLKFECVIMEEAHEASSDSYFRVMNGCRNAHYRLALTATPFMNDDMEANMRLMATAGEIAIQVSEQELIENGILARPYFRYLTARAPLLLSRTATYQKAVKMGITENEDRNRQIVTETIRANRHGLSGLILVQQRAHGEILKRMMQAAAPDIDVDYIQGSSSKAQRKAGIEVIKRGGILIGTTILDVGVDVPSVGFLAIGGGGKAETGLRQRIGRALRAKKSGPNICYIIDFSDPFHQHLKKHAKLRRAIVEQTPGFREGILAGDFDYAVFGNE